MKFLNHRVLTLTSPLRVIFFYLYFKCISFPGFPMRDADLVQHTLAVHVTLPLGFVKLLTVPGSPPLCLIISLS